jgi:hypothetical protein
VAPREISVDEARETLVRRYLTGFGPSTRNETDWAGIPVKGIAEVLDRMALRPFRAEDGAELVDLPGLPLPDPQAPAPARFLPTWDATLLAHARRSQILPERHRPRFFSIKMPQSLPAFLVDGRVAGTCYVEETVAIDEFEPLDPAVRRQVHEEAERLAAFHS